MNNKPYQSNKQRNTKQKLQIELDPALYKKLQNIAMGAGVKPERFVEHMFSEFLRTQA